MPTGRLPARPLLAGAALALAALVLLPPVEARPPAPALFCEVYVDAPACVGGDVGCDTCHTSAPSLNPYGQDLSLHLLVGEERPLHEDLFSAGLGDALAAVEALDSDQDGYGNLAEIEAGSEPGDAASQPAPADCTDLDDQDEWDLCGYDPDYAYKKVMIDFCGRSPTLAERRAFEERSDPSDALHEALDLCLDTEHWRGRGGRVWNLANKKIGPLKAVKAGRDSGPIPLADYDDDYAYFVWTQTDGRDARLVLTGQTFVSAWDRGGVTVYEEWDRSPTQDYEQRGYDRYQAVEKERRAGLLTHRWFLMSNTMFTAVPRTTAAQAYRAFLGYDISRLQGLDPVADEPIDYDDKGVGAAGCIDCHSTLDPLTYPFSRYEGIGGGNPQAPSYSYDEDRMDWFVDTDGADVADTPEAGVIFGQPVEDLLEWAQVAANSEAFRRATVLDYWVMLLGEPPRGTEQGQYIALVDALADEHGHSVEAMLHDLVDTEAYGAP